MMPNPVQGSRNMVSILKRLGADIQYTEYAELGHGETFDKAWQNPEILPWLFSQKKTNKKLSF